MSRSINKLCGTVLSLVSIVESAIPESQKDLIGHTKWNESIEDAKKKAIECQLKEEKIIWHDPEKEEGESLTYLDFPGFPRRSDPNDIVEIPDSDDPSPTASQGSDHKEEKKPRTAKRTYNKVGSASKSTPANKHRRRSLHRS